MRNHISVCAAIVSVSCLFSTPSRADILECHGPAGGVTYTNGQCTEGTRIRAVLSDNGGAMPSQADLPAPRRLHQTAWSRPLKVRNRRPDVTSIQAAKVAVQQMDSERLRRRRGEATQLAQYQEN